MKISQENRNEGLDALKFFAAILVCYQHAVSNVGIYGYGLAIARIAVPVFFMITGFYIEKIDIRKYIKKIGKIIIKMTVLYFCIDLLQALAGGNSLSYFSQFFDIRNIINFIIFNDPIVADHAWYLFALVYALPIVAIGAKKKKELLLYISIIIGIAFLLLCGKYSIMIWGEEISSVYTRCWLAVGIPFLAIGYFMNQISRKKSSRVWVSSLVIIIMLFNMVEKYILDLYEINATRDMYITTIGLAILVFDWFWSNGDFFENNIIAKWGKKYSTVIYIIHPIFVRAFNIVWRIVGVENNHIKNNLAPIIVIVGSFIGALFLEKVDGYIKSKRKSI